MELRVSRSRAKCAVCGSKLPPRTEAWFDDVHGTITCVSCERLSRPEPMVREIQGEPLAVPATLRSAPAAGPPEPDPVDVLVAKTSSSPTRPRIRSTSRSRPAPSATPAPSAIPGAPAAASPEPSDEPVGVAPAPSAEPAPDAEPEPAVEPTPEVEAAADAEVPQPQPQPAVRTDAGPEVGASGDVPTEVPTELPAEPDAPAAGEGDPNRPGPLVAELPFADGGAPLSWKGELFQGPPVPAAARVEPERPAVSVKFNEVVASLARGRAEPGDRIGAALLAAEDRGLIWMPTRRTPGGFEIDHLAVTPNGIWVVAAEPAPTGRVEKRDVGDWFTPEPRLYVGEDDHTHTIRRIESVDDSLRRALRGTIAADVPRYKVVSFVDSPPGWLDRPFPFDEVWVTWSHHLVEPMLSTVTYQRDDVADLAEVLDKVLVAQR